MCDVVSILTDHSCYAHGMLPGVGCCIVAHKTVSIQSMVSLFS